MEASDHINEVYVVGRIGVTIGPPIHHSPNSGIASSTVSLISLPRLE